jgi:WG containing repeat
MVNSYRKFLSILAIAGCCSLLASNAFAQANCADGCRPAGGYINKHGKFAIKPSPKLLTSLDFSEGLAWVLMSGGSGKDPFVVIDKHGRVRFGIAIMCRESDFHCGLSAVRGVTGTGYVNRRGKVVIPFVFLPGDAFNHGKATVRKNVNGEWKQCTIDTKGNIVADVPERPRRHHSVESKNIMPTLGPEFEVVGGFSEGLAPVIVKQKLIGSDDSEFTHKIGFINRKGKLVIPAKFTEEPLRYIRFSDGIAHVSIDGFGYCFINKRGKVLGKFCAARDFHDSLAAVSVVVDKNGKVVDPEDSSHGYQTQTSYALAICDLLKPKVTGLNSPHQIEFSVTPNEHTLLDLTMIQSSGDVEVDARLKSIVQSIVSPKRGLLIAQTGTQPTFKFVNGGLSLNFPRPSQRRRVIPILPEGVPVPDSE